MARFNSHLQTNICEWKQAYPWPSGTIQDHPNREIFEARNSMYCHRHQFHPISPIIWFLPAAFPSSNASSRVLLSASAPANKRTHLGCSTIIWGSNTNIDGQWLCIKDDWKGDVEAFWLVSSLWQWTYTGKFDTFPTWQLFHLSYHGARSKAAINIPTWLCQAWRARIGIGEGHGNSKHQRDVV